jgi:biopolymer transport protein ExbD
MAADLSSQEDDVVASINITPFVDVVLVLLIIFMVTSSAIVKASLQVDLPKAAAADKEMPATLNLVLTKEQVIYQDGVVSNEQNIKTWLQNAVKKGEKPRAVISADKQLSYGYVMKIIDLVKSHGVTGFALNIERGTETP